MNRNDEMSEIRQLIGSWLNEIALANAETYYDINKISEHLCRQLLNLLYGYQLIDLNEIKANFPGLDIGDEAVAKIAYQITSRTDRQKISENLKSVVDKKYHNIFSSGIKFLILNAHSKVEYTKKTTLPTTVLPTFDIAKDIVYPADLIKKIEDIYEEDDYVRFTAIKMLLSKELAPRFRSLVTHQYGEENQRLQELLKKAVERIEASSESAFQVSSNFFEGDLDVPDIKQLHHREKLLEHFKAVIDKESILWVHGPVSTGKTSAAVSLARVWTGKVLWIECRGITEPQLLEHILTSLGTYFNVPLDRTFKTSVFKLLDQVEPNTLIILNDIPQLSPAMQTKAHLSFFIGQALLAESQIVVTSNFIPTAEFGQNEGFDATPQGIPPFITEDTEGLLRVMDAPAELIQAIGELITTSTQGHPLLIKSAIKYLKERNWDVDREAIVSIFTGNFDLGPDRAFYQKLIDQTVSLESQELLYRLKFIIGSFDNSIVSNLAAIEPVISHSASKINDLLGSWVQQNKEGKYQVSPLVKKLGDNVSSDTKSSIYLELAGNILAKGNISLLDASSAILYYQLAGENNKAAIVLIKALTVIEIPQMFFDWGLNLYWYTNDLPGDMAPMFKAQIRIAQIRLTTDETQVKFLSDDLRKISEQEDGGEFEKLLAATQFFQTELRTNPLAALNNLLQLKNSSEKIDNYFETEEPIIDVNMLNGIWFVFIELKSIEQYREWFEKVNIKEYPDAIHDAETNEAYAMAAVSIYRNIVVDALEDGIGLEVLQEILELSTQKELWLLATYSLKFLVKVFAENSDLETALKLVNDYEWLLSKSEIFSFLVHSELGRQAFLSNKLDIAFQQITPLLESKLPDFYSEVLDFDMTVTQLYFKTDPDIAESFAEAGLDLANSNDIYILEDKIKQFGESAIAKTIVEKNEEALQKIAAGFELVLDNFQENDEYKALVIRFGHTALYIIQLLESGKPRDFGDGEKFVIPEPGFFYKNTDKLLEGGFYFDERKSMVATIINDGFEVILDKVNAKKWAYITFDQALAIGGGKFVPILQKIIFYLIEDKEFKKAYNVLAYIEDFYQQIIARVASGKSDKEEEELIERATKTKSISDDFGVYLHILFPTALEFSRGVKNGSLQPQDFQNSIEAAFESGQYMINNVLEYQTTKKVFERILIDRIGYDEMKSMVDSLVSSNKDLIYAIGCYLLSSFTDAQQAANLQLATLVTIDEIFKTKLKSFYIFSMVPYFEEFWTNVFSEHRSEFTDVDFLLDKGVILIKKTDFNLRIAKIFQVMSNHLKFNISRQVDAFIFREN